MSRRAIKTKRQIFGCLIIDLERQDGHIVGTDVTGRRPGIRRRLEGQNTQDVADPFQLTQAETMSVLSNLLVPGFGSSDAPSCFNIAAPVGVTRSPVRPSSWNTKP